jgi:hypothetical protein
MDVLLAEPTRARIYSGLNALVPIAIAYGLATGTEAAVLAGLAGAVLGNGMATLNAHNARAWLYGIATAIGAAAVVYGLASEAEATLWVDLAAALLGVTGTRVARFHTGPPPRLTNPRS